MVDIEMDILKVQINLRLYFITHSPCFERISKCKNLKSCRMVQFTYILSVLPSPMAYSRYGQICHLKNWPLGKMQYIAMSFFSNRWLNDGEGTFSDWHGKNGTQIGHFSRLKKKSNEMKSLEVFSIETHISAVTSTCRVVSYFALFIFFST